MSDIEGMLVTLSDAADVVNAYRADMVERRARRTGRVTRQGSRHAFHGHAEPTWPAPVRFDGKPAEPIGGIAVTAQSIGYVEIIDFASLDRIARESGAKVSLRARTGDFVHPHRPLVEIAGADPDEEMEARVRSCFSLGSSRTPDQDPEFLIDELVEIGLRALSPGINDPFTAVISIHWMGAAMAQLAERDLCHGPEQERYDPDRVQVVADDFRHFLGRSFGAIRASAAGSPIAAKMFLDALSGIAVGATSQKRRQMLLDEARLLVDQAETALKGPALDEVRERLAALRADVGGLPAVGA